MLTQQLKACNMESCLSVYIHVADFDIVTVLISYIIIFIQDSLLPLLRISSNFWFPKSQTGPPFWKSCCIFMHSCEMLRKHEDYFTITLYENWKVFVILIVCWCNTLLDVILSGYYLKWFVTTTNMAKLAVQAQLAKTLMKEIDKKSIKSHENEWMENPETIFFLRFILHVCGVHSKMWENWISMNCTTFCTQIFLASIAH